MKDEYVWARVQMHAGPETHFTPKSEWGAAGRINVNAQCPLESWDAEACWTWLNQYGHPETSLNSRTGMPRVNRKDAHGRYADGPVVRELYRLVTGNTIDTIDQTCGNPRCVNPFHLRTPITQASVGRTVSTGGDSDTGHSSIRPRDAATWETSELGGPLDIGSNWLAMQSVAGDALDGVMDMGQGTISPVIREDTGYGAGYGESYSLKDDNEGIVRNGRNVSRNRVLVASADRFHRAEYVDDLSADASAFLTAHGFTASGMPK